MKSHFVIETIRRLAHLACLCSISDQKCAYCFNFIKLRTPATFMRVNKEGYTACFRNVGVFLSLVISYAYRNGKCQSNADSQEAVCTTVHIISLGAKSPSKEIDLQQNPEMRRLRPLGISITSNRTLSSRKGSVSKATHSCAPFALSGISLLLCPYARHEYQIFAAPA